MDGVARCFEHHFDGDPEQVCAEARDVAIGDLTEVLRSPTVDADAPD
ncbi:MAG: hypothetical protein ACRDV7_06190 [Acidimicrobiia bacterium]